MTENEAIKNINTLNAVCMNKEFYDTDFYLALSLAVGALEKIQKFEAIGTIEEFKVLKEKAKSKKPIRKSDINGKYEEVTCPKCGRFVDDYTNKKYCNCGQALDWQ